METNNRPMGQTQAPTPTSSSQTQAVSYIAATNGGQAKLRVQEKKRVTHNQRFEVSFSIEETANQNPESELQNIRNTLTTILKHTKSR